MLVCPDLNARIYIRISFSIWIPCPLVNRRFEHAVRVRSALRRGHHHRCVQKERVGFDDLFGKSRTGTLGARYGTSM